MDFITGLQLYNTSVKTPLLDENPSYFSKLHKKPSNDTLVERFDKTLEKAMQTLKDTNTAAEIEMESYISGKTVDPAEVMLAMEKASMATNLAIQIRNRVVEGYKEINNIQV
ncbi:MAG: flagellar hook-basal body complex protein FliE [Candidatus Caenarcaniphilales bacterium]|nr:flagellar hook-basal body complex protein FliE [Candidatus Caenarcaniphilales bacterium]